MIAPNGEHWRFITLKRSGAGMYEGMGLNPEAGVDPLVIPEDLYQVHRIGQTVDDPREWCDGLVIIGLSRDPEGVPELPGEGASKEEFDAAFNMQIDAIIAEAAKLLRAALEQLEREPEP